MKKLTCIFLIALLGIGCSKEEDTNPNTYNATIRENFTNIYKQLENIQVGDYIPYTITLSDSKNTAKTEYRLISVKTGQAYHQTIGKDFVLSLSNEESLTTEEIETYLSFNKKGVHNFYIRPLVPGTFRLTFELQKFVDNEPIGDAIKVNVSFNAVKITFDIKITNSFTDLFRTKYHYFFKIEDGEDADDNYLSSEEITQTYTLLYTKEEKNTQKDKSETSSFTTGKTYTFDRSFSADKVTVKHLKITQKIGNTPDYIIEYYNLNIILKPE